MQLIKDNEKGKVYQADSFKIFYRLKGSISGDNSQNTEECIYLLSGSAEVTLENTTWQVQAPVKLVFPALTYHKIEALSDIIFILYE